MTPVLMVLGGHASRTQHQLISRLSRYLNSTGMTVRYVRHTRLRQWWGKLTGRQMSLAGYAPDALFIGVGQGCQLLVEAAERQTTPVRLVLIAPTLPNDYRLAAHIRHALIFYDPREPGRTMGTIGYSSECHAGQTIEDYNLARRDLAHTATWIWQRIYRSRLGLNRWKLLHAKANQTD